MHNGHLFVADEIIHLGLADHVLFVPAKTSPFKAEAGIAPGADAADRLEMLRAATAGRDGMSIDEWELEAGQVTYTVDTVDHLYRDRQLSQPPGMIIGADLLDRFDQWRDPQRLLSLVRPIIVGRPGFSKGEMPAVLHDAEPVYVDNRIIAVSSSEVRRRVRNGLAFCDLVPATVFDYVTTKGLYRDATR